MENMQQNMEAALRNIADNTRRGLHQGGHEVNQYINFNEFMDTRQYSKKQQNHWKLMNG
jgi:hypothetical protein